ncbi:MAG: membrane protein insertase YidC [Lentisphaeraceae bacterium]|nr:membrane protein insertase YidC [Lentisphaeraceae bacterium]
MDKKTVFLAVITGIAFYLWVSFAPYLEQKLGLTPQPQEAPQEQDAAVAEEAVEKSGEATSLDDKPKTTKTETVEKAVEEKVEKAVEKAVEDVVKTLSPEEVSTDEFSMTVNPQKGITEIKLAKHKQDMEDDSPLVVIGDESYGSLTLTGAADSWKYGTATVKKTENRISVIRPVLDQNFSVEKVIKLGKEYQFTISFRIINTGTEPLSIENLGMNAGHIKPNSLGAVGMMAGMDQGIDAYSKTDQSIETHFFQDILKDAQEIEKTKGLPVGKGKYFLETPAGGFQWIAVKNRYFTWVVDYEDGFKNCEVGYTQKKIVFEGKPLDENFATATGYFNDFKVQPGTTYEIDVNCFAGPQQYDILKKLSHEKKEIMQLNLFMWTKIGWIGFIAEWMLRAVVYFYSLVGSYGLAIIMLTIIVKALFWRLTNKSTESMKKMSTLSPKIKEINEKYKDNAQVKQQKIMELYREAGVNPVAGCLPLFLQMPIFIALFNALRGAIELRHSEFLWVADLSQPDTIFEIFGLPIRPLAIAWAASMFLQQKIVPSTADETQRKIMMFMPIVMLFICYEMPSGLTLYWTFSTFMSILQYYLNNKKASNNEVQTVAKTTTG